jgi:plastocyanin
MRTFSERQRTTLLAATVLVGACGGGSSAPPPDNTTPTAAAVSGNNQSGRVGQVLPDPLTVSVTDGGQPAAAVTVNWSTATGSGAVTPASVTTDANGMASSSWTLGAVSGSQTASASVTGATGSPVTFSASAVAGNAATLAKANGDGQTGEVNTALAAPVQARVTDEFGNAVAGVGVNWSATGASVSGATVASDGSGISQVSVMLGGTAGPITIVAESNGLTGSPLTFDATAVVLVPPPASISVTVANDFFQSQRNLTINPAVDTVAVGGSVLWTWVGASAGHNVTSTGSPGFTSSATQSAPANHTFTFSTAGTYNYHCTIHGTPVSGMRGQIVVR